MLEVKTKDGTINKMAIAGDLQTISADACIILKSIYDELNESNEDIANMFKSLMIFSVSSGAVFYKNGTEDLTEEDEQFGMGAVARLTGGKE